MYYADSHGPYFESLPSLPPQMLLRTQMLEDWIREDESNGHRDARTAVVKWRDDIWKRLPNEKPCTIKIPRCFVKILGLSSQSVWIEQNGTVWVHSAPENCDENGRRVLVAPRH